jgi:hypothetical protein
VVLYGAQHCTRLGVHCCMTRLLPALEGPLPQQQHCFCLDAAVAAVCVPCCCCCTLVPAVAEADSADECQACVVVSLVVLALGHISVPDMVTRDKHFFRTCMREVRRLIFTAVPFCGTYPNSCYYYLQSLQVSGVGAGLKLSPWTHTPSPLLQ